ncbi:hypothetical protein E2542_SST01096 [Spatholobus suberectus]|nr:hypothetical protein E2542_SST01096 [Spatholobus suberectus]
MLRIRLAWGLAGFLVDLERVLVSKDLCLTMTRTACIYVDCFLDLFFTNFDVGDTSICPLLHNIRVFLGMEWTLTFRHSLWEGNSCANWLAKHGAASHDPLAILLNCPIGPHSLLIVDTMGVTFAHNS